MKAELTALSFQSHFRSLFLQSQAPGTHSHTHTRSQPAGPRQQRIEKTPHDRRARGATRDGGGRKGAQESFRKYPTVGRGGRYSGVLQILVPAKQLVPDPRRRGRPTCRTYTLIVPPPQHGQIPWWETHTGQKPGSLIRQLDALPTSVHLPQDRATSPSRALAPQHHPSKRHYWVKKKTERKRDTTRPLPTSSPRLTCISFQKVDGPDPRT